MSAAKKKTTDKIKASLIQLLDTMPIEDVTATELCKRLRKSKTRKLRRSSILQPPISIPT